MKIPFFKNKKGFTIIETLVAIAVIMTAIAGPLTISQRGLNAATVARDQFIAQYLAQDAIEQFYYERDKAIMSEQEWLDELPTQGCNGAGGCTIDSFDLSNNHFRYVQPSQEQINDRTPLYKTPLGFFTHISNNNTLTPFSRQIWVMPITADQEVAVTVLVTWKSGKNTHSITITKNVFNL